MGASVPDLGVIERHELPHEFNGIEVIGWSLPVYAGNLLLWRCGMKAWLSELASRDGGFPDGQGTVHVKAWASCLGGGRKLLYTAQVKLPQ